MFGQIFAQKILLFLRSSMLAILEEIPYTGAEANSALVLLKALEYLRLRFAHRLFYSLFPRRAFGRKRPGSRQILVLLSDGATEEDSALLGRASRTLKNSLDYVLHAPLHFSISKAMRSVFEAFALSVKEDLEREKVVELMGGAEGVFGSGEEARLVEALLSAVCAPPTPLHTAPYGIQLSGSLYYSSPLLRT